MLLDFKAIVEKYGVHPRGVIHVGAHYGDEYAAYLEAGIKHIVFVEPCRAAFDELKCRFQYQPNVKLFNLALGDEKQTGAKMYTSKQNKGQSNSLLKPAKHLQIHPEIIFDGREEVDVELMDDLEIQPDMASFRYNLLVMDCQGYEGRVLRGARFTIPNIDYVYTEINKDFVYENNTHIDELDELLNDFKRVETGRWVGDAWTDAFYIRRTLLK